jgi:hypothetical protein
MTRPRLFHVSEEPGIARFEPRENYRVAGTMVWAVDEPHLFNFLTPRDCPRISFGRGPMTTEADAAAFLGTARRVVAFEAGWLDRMRACVLHIYELPAETFEPELEGAGYWISRKGVTPLAERREADLLGALVRAGAEIRVLQDFWPLSDAVANSSLEFSIIHKKWAQPRLDYQKPELTLNTN